MSDSFRLGVNQLIVDELEATLIKEFPSIMCSQSNDHVLLVMIPKHLTYYLGYGGLGDWKKGCLSLYCDGTVAFFDYYDNSFPQQVVATISSRINRAGLRAYEHAQRVVESQFSY